VDREKDPILLDIKNVLIGLAKEHDIKAAYVFGSYARGNAAEQSDIDVAIVLGSVRDGSPFDERFEIFHKVQQHNSLYEVVCFQEEEFAKGNEDIVRCIKKEGIRML
jgi:predicted nucleotidyltransferase